MIWRTLCGLLLTITACVAHAAADFDGQSWWSTVKVLADDKLEGRETGSAGERQAQAYIVEQLKALGIEPAGTDGYYQKVKLQTTEIQEASSSLALVHDGRSRPLDLGEQAFFSTRYTLAPKVDAPLVFVGYGLDHSGATLRRFGGSRSQGQGRGPCDRLARRHSIRFERPLSVARRALESTPGCRRHRHHCHPESGVHGDVLVAHRAQPRSSQHGPGGD